MTKPEYQKNWRKRHPGYHRRKMAEYRAIASKKFTNILGVRVRLRKPC